MNPKIDYKGTKKWRNSNGKLHREDGPAVEYTDGSRLWYINGQLHRIDGPAIEWVYQLWRKAPIFSYGDISHHNILLK